MADKVLPALSLAVLSATAEADPLPDELVVCRGLPDDARLACYDAAVDRGTVRATGRSSATRAAANPGSDAGSPASSSRESAIISQEQLFGMNKDEIQRTVEATTGEAQLTSLDAVITRLQQSGYGTVMITLDNGQIWRQVDSSSLRLRVGDAVEIERASFGSFMLQKKGSKRTMRVSRHE